MRYTGIQLLETAPVSTAIIRLALPMMAAMLSQAIYSTTDMFFLGQTGDSNMVAAVSIVYPIIMLTAAVGTVFSIGGSSYISRMLGLKNTKVSKNTSSVCFYLSLVSGLLIAILLFCIKTHLLENMGASEGTYAHADDYYSVYLFSIPFGVATMLFSGLLRSEGETGKAMKLQLLGIIINIILDALFILGLGWGTKGAAWATVIGQIASFIYGIWYLRGRNTSLSITPQNYKPNKAMLKDILFIGVPAGLSNLLLGITFVLGNRVAASYGDHVVAGSGIQLRIVNICIMLIIGLAMGYQPFAGFNFGAQNIERLRKGFFFTIIVSTLFCCAGGVVFFVFDKEIIRLFINDTQTIEAGAALLRFFVIGLIFIGLHVTLMTTYQALGKSLEAAIITFGRPLLVYIPLLYILNGIFGFNGFILALPLTDVFTAVLSLALSGSLYKIMLKKQSKAR